MIHWLLDRRGGLSRRERQALLESVEVNLFWFLADTPGLPASYRAQLQPLYRALARAAGRTPRTAPPPRRDDLQQQLEQARARILALESEATGARVASMASADTPHLPNR